MQVKTFEAVNMKDALKAIKREFGNDAVILSTKQKSGAKDGVSTIEVTATSAINVRSHGASAAKGRADFDAEDVLKYMREVENKITALTDNFATRKQVASLETSLQELKVLLHESIRSKDGFEYKDLPPSVFNTVKHLQMMGLNEANIAKLAQYLKALPMVSDSEDESENSDEKYRNHAIKWMLKRIKIAGAWTGAEGATTVHAIVGASGVGKTSAVAKIGAMFQMKEKVKVGFISLDNQRLAGSEQLRIYAKVINSPFTHCETSSEIERAVYAMRDCQMILIDVAGVGPKDTNQIREIERMKQLNIPVDLHLAIAATERFEHMDSMVRTIGTVGVQSLIYTKLDEAWAYGDIFNLTSKWNIPLSYFSMGREIPADLERASREKVIEKLFSVG